MTGLLSIFFVLLLAGAPIVFVIGASVLGYFVWTGQYHFLLVMPQRMFAGMDQFVLLAVPLFILAGALMEVGGLTQRLLSFANVCVGRFTGGVSLTAIWSSFLFGGVSGSAAADAAALGSVLIPEMKRQGYDKNYAAALMATSSILAPLIPPSISMVIYGSLSGTSIARLFVAGIVPGILLAILLSGYVYVVAKKHGYPRSAPPTWKEFLVSAVNVIPVMILPVIIVVGIRGGVFTPTEAAAVACLYSFVISAFFFRSLTWKSLRAVLLTTAVLTSSIFLMIAMANIASFIFAIERLPEKVVAALFAISENPVLILLMVNLILLALGMVLDAAAILILTVPALMGIGSALGMDPVHLGVVVVFNVLVGFITPPVGLCLFIVTSVAQSQVHLVSRYIAPLILLAIAVLLIITFVPEIVLFLPNLLVE